MIKKFWGGLFGARPAEVLPPPAAPLPPGAFPVLPARDLLVQRRAAVNRIEQAAGTTRLHFERYYLGPLWRFAAWAQAFPAPEAGRGQPGGLLDYGLESALAALRIRQGRLLPPGTPPEEWVLKQALWTYAVFTLALLGAARSAPGLAAVTVSGGDGAAEWAWNPWGGAIGDNPEARRYRVAPRPGGDGGSVWPRGTGVLLVPYLLDAAALAWLHSDRRLYGMWFACACGETARAGVLAEIVAQAGDAAFGRSADVPLVRPVLPPSANAAEPPPVESIEAAAPPVAPVPPAVLAAQPERPRKAEVRAGAGNAPVSTPGGECLAWIVSGVQSGRIPCNEPEARVHGVPDGVLLASPEVFQDYAESVGSEDFEGIAESFLALNLHRRTRAGSNIQRYALAGRDACVNGLLLANPEAVFGAAAPGLNPLLERL